MPTARPEVVVITGASAGVGRATARAFAKEGARIGLLARGVDGLEATRREVEELGGEAISVPTDVADASQVEAAADAVEEAFGAIDIWVNNAMTSVFAEFASVEPDEYRRVTDVCYHGQVFGTHAALKHMLPRDRGTIVLVGSALAYRGIPLQSAYCGAKHAVEGMFDAVRAELLHNDSRVHITMVQLPAMNTPQFSWVRSKLPKKAQPVPPIYQPEIAAEAIVFAARHRRRTIIVGAMSAGVIWGNKLAPQVADRYLARTGYDSQMRSDDEDPGRPDNLWDPVAGDHGAHGDFGRQSRSGTAELWVAKHRNWVLAGTAFLGAMLSVLINERS